MTTALRSTAPYWLGCTLILAILVVLVWIALKL